MQLLLVSGFETKFTPRPKMIKNQNPKEKLYLQIIMKVVKDLIFPNISLAYIPFHNIAFLYSRHNVL